MNMKTKWIATVVLGAAAATVGTAYAGSKWSNPISIDTVNRSASGTMSDVRSSSDTAQYFVCRNTAWSTSSPEADCWGGDASSPQKTFYCSTTNASMISAVQGLSTDSYVTVFWDSAGHCTELSIEKASTTSPKTP